MQFKLLVGDVLDRIKDISDKSINCCVTSPPYYGLRDYGTGTWVGGDPNCKHYRQNKIIKENTNTGNANTFEQSGGIGDSIYKTTCQLCGATRVDNQIGLEETPEEYIDRLVAVFREVKRVLRDDGILWVNIGDSYSGSHGNGYKQTMWASNGQYNSEEKNAIDHMPKKKSGCKPKDLIGIPWMLAFALRADGWYLRQDIIWAKNNPMPESVKDRCTRSHEYIFMLTKNRKYWFDHEAMQEPAVCSKDRRSGKGRIEYNGIRKGTNVQNSFVSIGKTRNKRDVWLCSTNKNVKKEHFAVYPKKLIEPCILAGCPENGWVLDPFNGSGTSGIVTVNNGRNYIGIELNPKFIDITKSRIYNECTDIPNIDLK